MYRKYKGLCQNTIFSIEIHRAYLPSEQNLQKKCHSTKCCTRHCTVRATVYICTTKKLYSHRLFLFIYLKSYQCAITYVFPKILAWWQKHEFLFNYFHGNINEIIQHVSLLPTLSTSICVQLWYTQHLSYVKWGTQSLATHLCSWQLSLRTRCRYIRVRKNIPV